MFSRPKERLAGTDRRVNQIQDVDVGSCSATGSTTGLGVIGDAGIARLGQGVNVIVDGASGLVDYRDVVAASVGRSVGAAGTSSGVASHRTAARQTTQLSASTCCSARVKGNITGLVAKQVLGKVVEAAAAPRPGRIKEV